MKPDGIGVVTSKIVIPCMSNVEFRMPCQYTGLDPLVTPDDMGVDDIPVPHKTGVIDIEPLNIKFPFCLFSQMRPASPVMDVADESTCTWSASGR